MNGESLGATVISDHADLDFFLIGFTEAHPTALQCSHLADEEGVWVWVQGELFATQDPVAAHATDDAAGGDDIRAPMPGNVQKIAVEIGQSVSRGDTLAVLEAMKMEHALKAPRDGVVGEIAVRVGEQVTEKQLLVALEKEAAAVE
jgi:biotin carboxyl carrier protein